MAAARAENIKEKSLSGKVGQRQYLRPTGKEPPHRVLPPSPIYIAKAGLYCCCSEQTFLLPWGHGDTLTLVSLDSPVSY